MSQKNNSRMAWYTFAFIVFGGVWGFGNTINGFSTYGGLKAIIPWLIVFIVYFIPYALMVGELGSSFKNEEGGVSSWIKMTIGPTAAYFAGWTYWIVHMPYMSQKPSAAVMFIRFAFFVILSINTYTPMYSSSMINSTNFDSTPHLPVI